MSRFAGGNKVNFDKKAQKAVWGLSIFALVILLIFNCVVIVNAGERAVILRLGKVERVVDPGFNVKLPFIESTIKTEVRTVKIEVEATSASKDLQTVATVIALNFNVAPEGVGKLYEEVGRDYRVRIIDPAVQDIVKAATARFNAEALITQRAVVKDEMEANLKARLAENHIAVTSLSIVDFKFSDEFNRAIEAKVTAEQRALEAENKLKQVEFESKQRIEQARGEAEAIRIQAQAITQQGGRDYVQLQAIQKWDGKLPQQWVPGSAVPFLNLNQIPAE